MKLLTPDHLIKTGEVDQAAWNYKLLIGWIQRERFRLALTLLNGKHYEKLLEIGYGSGIFMPELKRYCNELFGIDIHKKCSDVSKNLASFNVQAKLHSGSIECTDFEDSYFDCAIVVSALEFVSDIETACREIVRILKPGSNLIVVTPGNSKILDFGLKILTGRSAQKDFDDRREKLLSTLFKYFTLEKCTIWPAIFRSVMPVYTAIRLHPQKHLPS